MINSRRKGYRAQWEIMRQLRSWWGGHWEGRSAGIPGSDLITPEDFPYCVEVKNEASIKIRHFFKPSALLIAHWKQAVNQTKPTVDTTRPKGAMLVTKAESIWFVLRSFLPEGNRGSGFWADIDDQQVYVQTLESLTQLQKDYFNESL